MRARWDVWLVAGGMAVCQGLSATPVQAQARRGGELAQQLAVVEQQIAELKQLEGDPRQLAEMRFKRLLQKRPQQEIQDLKRSLELLKGARFRKLENRKQLIEQAERQLEVYERVVRYQQRTLSLEQTREALFPAIERDARSYIESGALAEDIAALERRRDDFLKIRDVLESGAGRQ